MTLADKISGMVEHDTNGGCWLWTGSLSRAGYARLRVGSVNTLAHRTSYQEEFGKVPRSLFVLHKCDVRCCVNPHHLYAGTAAQNSADCVTRNRINRWKGRRAGRDNPNARLTEKDVRAIRSSTAPTKQLARALAVAPSTVRSVRLGRSWRQK